MTAAAVATPTPDLSALLMQIAAVADPAERARTTQAVIESLTPVRDTAIMRAAAGEVATYEFCERLGMGKAETMKVVSRLRRAR